MTQNKQLTALRFPFLGSREEGESFAYLLYSLENDGAEIRIFDWFVKREVMIPDEKIYLYIPEKITREYVLRHNVPGIIKTIHRDESEQADVYKIKFTDSLSLENEKSLTLYQLANELQTTDTWKDLLLNLIKDSTLLKLGICIYLKHLGPYFSRISDFSVGEYSYLKEILLSDIANRVKDNSEMLRDLHISLEKELQKVDDIPVLINLEELREIIESEISLALFRIVFPSAVSLKEGNEEYNYQKEGLIITYLEAIKELEKRLYSNYNQIVLMYVKTLQA